MSVRGTWVRACLVTQPCLTLRNPMDCSPPGSSVHGILQARILEWVAMLCSRGSSQPRDRTHLSYVSGIGRWEAHVVNMHNLTWMSLKVHLQVTFQALQVTLTLWAQWGITATPFLNEGNWDAVGLLLVVHCESHRCETGREWPVTDHRIRWINFSQLSQSLLLIPEESTGQAHSLQGPGRTSHRGLPEPTPPCWSPGLLAEGSWLLKVSLPQARHVVYKGFTSPLQLPCHVFAELVLLWLYCCGLFIVFVLYYCFILLLLQASGKAGALSWRGLLT